MKRFRLALFAMFASAACVLSCAHTAPADAEGNPAPGPSSLANVDLTAYIPGFKEADIQALAAKPQGKALLEAARAAAQDTAIPETTYSLYRVFKESGERNSYQSPYYKKRRLLASEVFAVWLGGDTQRLSRVNDLIWSICEESNWVVPAHEKPEPYIDLFAAETGATLAHIDRLLGDQLPAEIRERIRKEVKTRILDLYLDRGAKFGWSDGRNNWTGVCAGSVGETVLLLETDPERRARALTLVQEQLGRFLEKAFASDGASLEGVGYWNFGLSHYVIFAEMLRAYTSGAVDLLANPKLKAIAAYPTALFLGNDLYASFSDAHEHNEIKGFLAAKLAERTGVTELLGLAGHANDWIVGNMVCQLLWWDGETKVAPSLSDVVLPVSGLARLCGEMNGKAVVVAAKAGDNAEPHNHNDVGTFIVCVDGVVYLCDPGAGLYNRDYFSKKRYENVFANSYGHSVPRIGGKLQETGPVFRGTMTQGDGKSVRITLNEAYPEPALKEAARVLSLTPDAVNLEDTFRFDGAGKEVEEAFVTWQRVEADGPVARIITDKGVLELRTDAGTFTAEALDEACRANHHNDTLTRIAVVYPAVPNTTAHITMHFHPAP